MMRLQLTLQDFDMTLYDQLQEEVNKYAACTLLSGDQGDGGTTVWLSCEADMVHCMEVIAIADLYHVRDLQLTKQQPNEQPSSV